MESDNLAVEVAGLCLENPLMLASGVIGTTPGGLKRVVREGGGGVVTKSLGPAPREGHSSPNVVKVESGYLNAMGLPNPGVDEFASEMEGEEIGATVLGSIYGGTPEEFLEVALSIASEVDGLELNLSCPHAEKLGAAIGADPNLVEDFVGKVAGEVEKPVFAKLTPSVSDIKDIGKAAEAGGADGLVAINTLPGMAIDIKTRRPVLGNRSGGLSGPAIHPVAVKSVYDLYEVVSVPIIGVGGVEAGEDLVELILAGASAVQVGTAIAERGLSVFGELRAYLSHYLDSSDMDLEELVGAAHEF